MIALRKPGVSNGATSTVPPSEAALAAIASASATRRFTFQCGGTFGSGGAIAATTSRGIGWPSSPPT